jgi:hypothetical protein
VVLINKIGLVEVYCKNGSLIIQSRGILGIIISNDCRVSVANQLVIKAQINEEWFLPMVIYTKNDTFSLSKNEIGVIYYSYPQIVVLGIIIIFIIGIIISMLIICKKQRISNYNHSTKKYNIVEIKEMDEIFLNK